MFDSAITSVIAIDTETNSIHFYSEPSAATPNNHLVANFRCRPFDDEFYEKFDKILKAYQQKNAGSQPAKVSLILPDHVFLTDTINIPTIGRRAMENSLELAIGAMYKNKNDLKYHTFSMAQNKQFTTYGLVGIRKDLLARVMNICTENQISVQNVTFVSNAMANGAMTLNQKLKNGTFMLLDIKENLARIAFVNKGRTIGTYDLPFGYSMLYKSRLAAEDLLFDHTSGELLVLNAQEKAKARQLTMMGEEVLTDPDENDDDEKPFSDTEGAMFHAGTTGDGKRTARKLPKFMLRDTPTDRDGFVYENFRIFVKWTLELLANNPSITSLGAISTVYVNMPKEYEFLYEMVNAEEKENKVSFAPLLTGASLESAVAATDLELYGGFQVKQFNKLNNF